MFLWDVKPDSLENREIMTGDHCFGCTAGAGSSCGGAIVVASGICADVSRRLAACCSAQLWVFTLTNACRKPGSSVPPRHVRRREYSRV